DESIFAVAAANADVKRLDIRAIRGRAVAVRLWADQTECEVARTGRGGPSLIAVAIQDVAIGRLGQSTATTEQWNSLRLRRSSDGKCYKRKACAFQQFQIPFHGSSFWFEIGAEEKHHNFITQKRG